MYLLTVQFSLHVSLPEEHLIAEAPQQNIERRGPPGDIYKGSSKGFFLS